MNAHAGGEVEASDFVREHGEIQANIRATAWLLSSGARRGLSVKKVEGAAGLLKTAEALDGWLRSSDPVERRRGVEVVAQKVSISTSRSGRILCVELKVPTLATHDESILAPAR